MLNIVIFGPPGSGKGTQSEAIIEKYGLSHISTGEILRAEIKAGSDIGIIAASYIDRGNNSVGVIFDGFPRTVAQARALKEMLARRNQTIEVMLNLEVNKEELIARLLKRGETSGRSDDNLETITKRIEVYERDTAPVIDFYKAEGLYRGVCGVGSVDRIFERISEALDICIA